MSLSNLVNYRTHIKNMEKLSNEEYDSIKKRLRVRGVTLTSIAEQCGASIPYTTFSAQNMKHGRVADEIKATIVEIIGEEGWNPYIVPRTDANEKKQLKTLKGKPGTGRARKNG